MKIDTFFTTELLWKLLPVALNAGVFFIWGTLLMIRLCFCAVRQTLLTACLEPLRESIIIFD